jgi:hypothetical protein
MQALPVDLGAELTQSVKLVLKNISVEAAPVLEERAKPLAGNTKLPTRAEVRGQPSLGESGSELVHHVGREDDALLAHSHLATAAHALILA